MSYHSKLNIRETQYAIRVIKANFQALLSEALNLERISGPIIVNPRTGLNDNLSGNEKAVSFYAPYFNQNLEVVQSLAKWKRFALKKYGFEMHEGIYVDMNAIRPQEKVDALHSLYVDQWDWELIIDKSERNLVTLKTIVTKIYQCIYQCKQDLQAIYPQLEQTLPPEIKFYQTQEVEDLYPNMEFNQAVKEIVKKDKAVFFIGIGKTLKSGKVFDHRAVDYDDWNLNGDIFVWSDAINDVIELSSMGIRVDATTLLAQSPKEALEKLNDYYSAIINHQLDQTIGGGIGQSRLCMFLLEKIHIAEVQTAVWDEEQIAYFEKMKIDIL